MRVGVIQSAYIPWRGYFDFIASVDAFVIHDDIQYTKGDWRNRNKIKTPQGVEWLSVPVSYKSQAQLIIDTQISSASSWKNKHLERFEHNYSKSPFLSEAKELIANGISMHISTISQLNINLIRSISSYLNINTPIILSSELHLKGTKTDRLIDLLKKMNATCYLSGPRGDAYLEKEKFQKNGIRLEYKTYDYAAYPQLWGEFVAEVTVLDLIANCGPKAKEHITSNSANRIIID